jgi:tetratricopeptide (TPR) repeat protein
MRLQIALGCLALWLVAAPARAEWFEASGDHFVIYGNQPEQTIKSFAEKLERFHAGMSAILNKPRATPSPSNRVTIYVVGDTSDVRHVMGSGNRLLAGAYMPRAGSSVAIVPRLTATKSDIAMSGDSILFHEYAHHFLYSSTDRAFPRWFVEGFAEYFSAVRPMPDGSLAFGSPDTNRAMELQFARNVPIRALLEYDGGASRQVRAFESFYGQSWALFHYLQTEPSRVGQLQDYQRRLGNGEPALAASEGAFGDLDQLDKDMKYYVRRRRMMMIVVDKSVLPIGSIQMRALRPGEAAMMPIVFESKAGVDLDEARALLPEARRVAVRYPDDPAVLAALAEAAFDAGYDDEAIAAADQALAIDPARINAHIQKGYALTRKAQGGASGSADWKAARSQWVKANKVEHDHPVPLVQYYLSFIDQGESASKVAVDGLEWAMQLASFDTSLRWLVANQMIVEGRYGEAAWVLEPLAYSPHPGEYTEKARLLLQEVAARQGGAAKPAEETAGGN